MRFQDTLCLLLGIWLMLASPTYAASLYGKCLWVKDGDTIVLQTKDEEKITVRLQGIDAPEKAQTYGEEAKARLTELIQGKKIRILLMGKDHYKRTVGRVFLKKRAINTEMVAGGFAWHSDLYAPDDKELAQAQVAARYARRGLWQHAAPLPPWEWRKLKKEQRSNASDGRYWVSAAGKIHNRSCHAYGRSDKGTYTDTPQGVNCKSCGGTN